MRDDLTDDDLFEKIKDKIGSDSLEITAGGCLQEFFDCDEVIGYNYDVTSQEYVPTKRVQIKYSEKSGIHYIPVKELTE